MIKRYWRYAVSAFLFFIMAYMGVKFCNAGHSYEQDLPFRIFCICFSLQVLIFLPPKDTLTVWSLLYLPVCYVVTHVAYEKHWIPDNCDYQFVELIRLGKGVALGWGLMLIALLKHIVREDLARKFFAALHEMPLYKKLFAAGWLLYAVVLTVANPGFAYVIVFTIGFPSVIIACREEENRRQLFHAFLDGALLCFLFLSVRSMLHRPYDTERYLFYFSNENMCGMYLSTVVIMLAVRIESLWKLKKSRARLAGLIVFHLLAVWAGVLVIFNYTRTYLLGMGFSFFVYFLLRVIGNKEKKRFILRFLLPFVLTLLLMYPGYLVLRYVPAYSASPVFFTGEYGNPTRVYPGDPVDSPCYTSFARYLTLSLGKWGIELHIDEDYAPSKEGDGVIGIDTEKDVSNGRMVVWKLFLSHMSLKGHYPGDIELEDGKIIYHSHNTYFQNMFQYGVPVGILFGLMILLSYVCAVIFRKKSADEMQTFSLLALGDVMVGMMTEWSGHPVYPFGCFLLLALCGIFYAKGSESKKQPEEQRA
ncbi:MAG: hypothetical protein K6E50_06540 [Lachnospiraceae bacterium]|nr:hypothetical protein [Lachnospiraceae bacterium]